MIAGEIPNQESLDEGICLQGGLSGEDLEVITNIYDKLGAGNVPIEQAVEVVTQLLSK
jgi:hypothetical protein